MAQQMMVPAAEPDDLSVRPRTHMMDEENLTGKLTSTGTLCHMYHTHTHNK